MKKFAPWFLFVLLVSLSAFAEDEKGVLPSSFLAGMHPRYTHIAPGGPYAKQKEAMTHASNLVGNFSSSTAFPHGVDTLINFTGSFRAHGVYLDGTHRDLWQYSMVGRGPSFNGTTVINAPVIPVTISMLNADGSPRFIVTNRKNCPNCKPGELGKKVRLISRPEPFITRFLNSPVFGLSRYSSSPVRTQIVDAEQRAEFGSRAARNWHTLLLPSLKKGLTMALTDDSTYSFALNDNGSCCAFVLVDANIFNNELFPPTAPADNSTVMGAAEVNGDITPKDIATFFFPNVYLYKNGNVNDCCTLGFHSFDEEPGDARNGNRTKFYVMNYSSWISPGLFGGGFEDVTAHSHEVAEIFNDPFIGFDNIHNITPFWLDSAGQCQDLMEVGDVIEDLSNPSVPVKMGRFTYHPQTVAELPWFEFKSPSFALNDSYSYPNENALTALSAPQALNCNGQ